MPQPPPGPPQILLSIADLERAVADGVLSHSDVERLTSWATTQRSQHAESRPATEQRKGFNLVTVLYYFGAMLMISACAWFLGDKWNALGPGGVCITALVYMLGLTSLGAWLRRKGFLVGGGLLITVAVSLTPLVTY